MDIRELEITWRILKRRATNSLALDSKSQTSLPESQIESNIVRCPDPVYAEKMIAAIDYVRTKGDSVGGVVTCIVRNVPRGLGSPIFDKLETELEKDLMSLPATKGFEIGSGFSGTLITGSEHNDEFYMDERGDIRTRTNRSGGIQIRVWEFKKISCVVVLNGESHPALEQQIKPQKYSRKS